MPLLNPADALNHLKTYERGDGLSVQELMDSRTRGGLTVSYFYYKVNICGLSLFSSITIFLYFRKYSYFVI